MLRRNFIWMIGNSALAWPWLARAQQTSRKVWRIAYLYPGSLADPADHAVFDVFRGEMKTLGYTEGKNLVIDDRSAEGRLERLPSLLTELIALRPDAIVAVTTPAIAAAQRATSTIPIIMAPATDPIGSGFVKSFARPGGNITGMANMIGDAVGKGVELLHTILPSAKRIAVLTSGNPTHPQQYELAETAMKALGLVAVRVPALTPSDLEPAFETMKRENCDAIFVLGDATRPAIATLAAKSRIPAVYQSGPFMSLGGLASYHPKIEAIYIKVAQYVDRIFKGANPAEYPVEQPVIFELAVNLKTAAALGMTIPDSVLARADKVIE
ncbi:MULTISPECIES: ABC transporter substrate-binding protein [unclassified Bradyrhizobium]|uniref:ABC transporter substrate-binding protein n=1 Tax=unclassified Bradyrhizobium TaxID=2631580 RepID=UPI002479BDE8|nr:MULTISPECIES: ABC transporter substrate-binding protein [unclassified Bradyrhizobium]WGR73586.1 ABC transporter substrate-binding protein [Bradyrhizobium sp. ISRA426]WGR78423.1 ABC transporter substrate-binding protein [Bradyrhizobium sp. ISRA430]WGR88825.1 ABC transporter substrate-binding protein [Bradyrhizobium sp. ISRA432]